MTKAQKYNFDDAEVDYRAGSMSANAIATKRGWVRPVSSIKVQKVAFCEIDSLASSGFVYVIYVDANGQRFYKIGLSKKFNTHMASHQCSSPFEVCVAIAYFVPNMRAEELALHAIYKNKRVRGEWFKLDDADLIGISRRTLLVSHE